ncbi:hypothetical protein KDW77_gp59 [Mycobacterium phage Pinnie]|uniref:Uncharacterized protein n=1 Tax=Mycobacterium phage Pinnie TaxID=2517965 RepID=A0A482J9R7_9CAUD|nr:hypothetical protein KDW77_gp59 [Mycobacterium phage Pinnie]QBP30273.1 hypothetical protein SEA_PINNIE_59 [Mycobacterium phage Pinnie]
MTNHSPIPAPPATRVPTVWGDDCRYCKRYRRPCGRHEDLTLTPAPLVAVWGPGDVEQTAADARRIGTGA